MDQSRVGSLVLPGDCVGRLGSQQGEIRLGPGLTQNDQFIIASKPGTLHHKEPDRFWIGTNAKRYVVAQDDMVIGFIVERLGENYKVDLGAAHYGTLPVLAFEGATRKNRPQLQPGDVVYARVVLANKDIEPELACTGLSGKSSGFGHLSGGNVIECGLGVCRSLLRRNCLVLQILGKKIPYEIAVGLNGRVWINSGKVQHTILLGNAITTSYGMSDENVRLMVNEVVRKL